MIFLHLKIVIQNCTIIEVCKNRKYIFTHTQHQSLLDIEIIIGSILGNPVHFKNDFFIPFRAV